MREVTSMSHIRHPNLVALLGFCKEEDECFLVYELCTNGNLSEWLFGNKFSNNSLYLLGYLSEMLNANLMLQEKIKPCHGHKDLRLQSVALAAFGFFIPIQKAVLFIGM